MKALEYAIKTIDDQYISGYEDDANVVFVGPSMIKLDDESVVFVSWDIDATIMQCRVKRKAESIESYVIRRGDAR